MSIQVFEVKGSWVDDTSVTFAKEKMVLLADHERVVSELEAKLEAFSWKLITPEICLTQNQEIGAYLPDLWDKPTGKWTSQGVAPACETYTGETWMRYGWTHYRTRSEPEKP